MTKKILSIFLVSPLLPLSVLAFSDLDSSHPYYEAISLIETEGIVQGYPDGTFRPDNKINRAEMLKILVEAFYDSNYNEASQDTDCFSDLDSTAWYAPYVCFAKDEGIIKGYQDGTFKPARNISFVEGLKISLIANGYEYVESDPWYKNSVETASSENYIPLSITTFNQEITRGEMSDMIARMLSTKADNLDNFLGSLSSDRVTYTELQANSEESDSDPDEIDINNPPASANCDSGDFNPDLLCLINKHRAANNLSNLVIDENLTYIAQKHSEWMDENDELTHEAEGKGPFDRCDEAYVNCSAENIAMSSNASAQSFFDLWKESPPHNENMLGNYDVMGIGLSGYYSTTLFAN